MASAFSRNEGDGMPRLAGKANELHLFHSFQPCPWFDDELGFMDDRLTLALQRDVRLR